MSVWITKLDKTIKVDISLFCRSTQSRPEYKNRRYLIVIGIEKTMAVFTHHSTTIPSMMALSRNEHHGTMRLPSFLRKRSGRGLGKVLISHILYWQDQKLWIFLTRVSSNKVQYQFFQSFCCNQTVVNGILWFGQYKKLWLIKTVQVLFLENQTVHWF